mmetsp:Transcript_3987/g.10404  ORF Transcript_3987/g.10404 Transcript_3987/m.10404 type:complete len:230 (+) Transcript_3987:509-1198(+)
MDRPARGKQPNSPPPLHLRANRQRPRLATLGLWLPGCGRKHRRPPHNPRRGSRALAGEKLRRRLGHPGPQRPRRGVSGHRRRPGRFRPVLVRHPAGGVHERGPWLLRRPLGGGDDDRFRPRRLRRREVFPVSCLPHPAHFLPGGPVAGQRAGRSVGGRVRLRGGAVYLRALRPRAQEQVVAGAARAPGSRRVAPLQVRGLQQGVSAELGPEEAHAARPREGAQLCVPGV